MIQPMPRKFYVKNRKSSEAAGRMEEGKEVQPLSPMSLETLSWLATKGEGMGRRIIRFASEKYFALSFSQ